MSDNTKLIDVILPQLAESLVSATIGKWLKQPGDQVDQYEPICDLITDKVNAELPSTVEGTLVELLAEEGQTVNVGEVIARIAVAVAAPQLQRFRQLHPPELARLIPLRRRLQQPDRRYQLPGVQLTLQCAPATHRQYRHSPPSTVLILPLCREPVWAAVSPGRMC